MITVCTQKTEWPHEILDNEIWVNVNWNFRSYNTVKIFSSLDCVKTKRRLIVLSKMPPFVTIYLLKRSYFHIVLSTALLQLVNHSLIRALQLVKNLSSIVCLLFYLLKIVKCFKDNLSEAEENILFQSTPVITHGSCWKTGLKWEIVIKNFFFFLTCSTSKADSREE